MVHIGMVASATVTCSVGYGAVSCMCAKEYGY